MIRWFAWMPLSNGDDGWKGVVELNTATLQYIYHAQWPVRAVKAYTLTQANLDYNLASDWRELPHDFDALVVAEGL